MSKEKRAAKEIRGLRIVSVLLLVVAVLGAWRQLYIPVMTVEK